MQPVSGVASLPCFQIRLRCQKGIPPSLRGRAWQYLSGGKVKLEQNPQKFDVSRALGASKATFPLSFGLDQRKVWGQIKLASHGRGNGVKLLQVWLRSP